MANGIAPVVASPVPPANQNLSISLGGNPGDVILSGSSSVQVEIGLYLVAGLPVPVPSNYAALPNVSGPILGPGLWNYTFTSVSPRGQYYVGFATPKPGTSGYMVWSSSQASSSIYVP